MVWLPPARSQTRMAKGMALAATSPAKYSGMSWSSSSSVTSQAGSAGRLPASSRLLKKKHCRITN